MARDVSLTSAEFGDSVVAKIKIKELDSFQVATVTGLQILSLESEANPADKSELKALSNYQMDVLTNICSLESCVAIISAQLADDQCIEDGLADAVRLPLDFDQVGARFNAVDVTWPSFLVDQSHTLQVLNHSKEWRGYNGIALLVRPQSPDTDSATILRELAWKTTLETVAVPGAASDHFDLSFLLKLLDYWQLIITTTNDGWFVEGYYTMPEALELIRTATQPVIGELLRHPWVRKNRELLAWNSDAGALSLPGRVCWWLTGIDQGGES